VATSLPTIQKALGITQDQMSWIQTAYLITEIISIPLTGLLTRILSIRWLFVTAVSVFAAGLDRVRGQLKLFVTHRVAHFAGLRRRHGWSPRCSPLKP
jgi:MFS family permease